MLQDAPSYSIGRGSTKDAVFLDMNESYRQWAKLDFLQLQKLNRYPDDSCMALRRALCDTYLTGFAPEQVMISAGSTELIDLVLRGFCKKGLLVNEPCYEVYGVKAAQNGLNLKKVLLREDFSVDVSALRANAADTDVLVLINPNNPTGSLVSAEELEEILGFYEGLVIVDEAYIEFAGLEKSLASYATQYPNVVVLRSFSKAWGLAGIRLGYALASGEIIAQLMKLKGCWNVSVMSQEAGLQVLRQQDGLFDYIEECLALKNQLLDELHAREIQTIDTYSNFILIKIPDSTELHQHLTDNDILVRHKGHMPLLDGTIRISIGDNDDHARLIQAVEEFYY